MHKPKAFTIDFTKDIELNIFESAFIVEKITIYFIIFKNIRRVSFSTSDRHSFKLWIQNNIYIKLRRPSAHFESSKFQEKWHANLKKIRHCCPTLNSCYRINF